MGIGVHGAAEIGVHRIVAVGGESEPEPQPPDPEIEINVEPAAEAPHEVGLVLYAPAGEALVAPERTVQRVGVQPPYPFDPRLVLLAEPDSVRARSFRLLAHRLRHGGDPRVVLVTSARPGEGKTTTAVNLALALAEDGAERVLLLEANARTPCLAELFGIDRPIGLPRQMARRETALLPWTAWEVAETGLSVLPADPEDALAPSRATFRTATRDLRAAYDYVVVDAPSTLDSADAMALVSSVDAIVLAARARKTRARELERARHQLTPAQLLGVVLLDIRETARS
jgi:Mrp family chromosome partitioning ATPase